MQVPFVMTKSGINLYVNGKMESVANDHPNYDQILLLLTEGQVTADEISKLVDLPKAVAKYSQGRITIDNDTFKYDGIEMHNALTSRILDLLKRQKPVEGLIKFMENLMQNPSFRAVNELYGFLDACTLPITPDGYFLAYKKISKDYKSIHQSPDGTHMDHSMGKVVSMPRNMVDENPNQTCSNGLHCCSFGYLSQYGGGEGSGDRVVIVKVNPKDVVAVPVDYNNQKMRVCEYQVVSEIPNDNKTELKDRYNTDETYLGDGEDEDEDVCSSCDVEDCESRTSPYRAPASRNIKPASKSDDTGFFECTTTLDRTLVEYYENMTRNQAKAAFARDFDVPYTTVRCRLA